ncbi:SDR family NAD(P)-dependent oxidoreductase [Solicola sp. PLA-1-18]|uniref:SDR family NAD(P)-dependent oxidoreductase n=1 Tax=Solicola sp. PLA-1-18 TaxID=3380532 RepID=UPI003B7D3F19
MTHSHDSHAPVALVTGASRGLGLALVSGLVEQDWEVVVDGRDAAALAAATRTFGDRVVAVPGDVADPAHRSALLAAVERYGRLDLLVHNASTLGQSPMPRVDGLHAAVLRHALEVNVVAPSELTRLLLPHLRRARGTVLAITSDAAVEPYETWGAYGASKAALDQLVAVLATEEPDLVVHAVDPGDMRTQMHADAFPGEDISDRPLPETVVPHLLRLLDTDRAGVRLRTSDLVAVAR